MSSFQDASRTPSVTAESVAASRTSAHSKGKKTSPVWAHTREPLEHEDQELLYCSYCELDDKPHGAKTASSMSKHIRNIHKTVKGDETQHLYVVSPTNLQLLMESAELSLSRWRSFGRWLRPWRSCDGLPADSTGSDGPECRDFTVTRNLNCLRTL
jgi:hypothetical protein